VPIIADEIYDNFVFPGQVGWLQFVNVFLGFLTFIFKQTLF
jgi:hypothetical protein